MTDVEFDAIVQGITDAVLGNVRKEMAVVFARLETFDKSLPVVGPTGPPGKDADVAEVTAAVMAKTFDRSEFLAKFEEVKAYVADATAMVPPVPEVGPVGPPGPTGADGKDADPEFIRAEIAKAVAEIPIPKDGAPGDPGAPGRDGVDGKDGESFTIEKFAAAIAKNEHGFRSQMAQIVSSATIEHLKAFPPTPGKDGAPGAPGEPGRDGADGVGVVGAMLGKSGNLVVTLSNGEIRDVGIVQGQDGAPGAKGLDGADGRDGVGHDDVDEVLEDDGRVLVRKYLKDGVVVREFRHQTKSMVYRGVFTNGRAYEPGDCVTWGGSAFVAEKSTTSKPGESHDESRAWRLFVKRGNQGPTGIKGEVGPRGLIGPMGPQGKPVY